ncbi:MAG TPA: hypothetical protein VH143_10490 [Kofleriaceae bacterium]|jgi:type IV pilus assembly protein PilY1|nr:hypothetical protein [Kofleriaceae bacterium]
MRGTLGKRLVTGAAVAAGLAIGAGPATANTSTAFPSGSLIIPVSSAFQDDCGSVSSYGLIYDVLRANPYLTAHGYTAITIFYDYLDTKQSPNRCVPTTLDTAPSVNAMWTDGCDINNVQSVLINNANHNTSADTTIVTYNNSAKTNVFPKYPSQTVSGFARVSYAGGPFVILASDAGTFAQLLDGTIAAKDVNNNTIDFTQFRVRNSTQKVPPTSSCSFGTDHYVNVHRAKTAFVANIGKAFQAVPPRLALLATNKNSHTSSVYNNILQGYLKNSGLDYTGAAGCPPGAIYAGNTTYCPNGAVSGQIFDSFDFDDLVNNKLASVSAGQPLYTMLWTPHWETTQATIYQCSGSNCKCNTNCTSACAKQVSTGSACTQASTSATINSYETTAISYIASFLNGQTGLAAECASLSSLEGSTNAGSMSGANTAGLQLQTCLNSGTNTCSASTTAYGVNRSSLSIPGSGLPLVNCSDPTTASGSECAYYSYPGDSFAQTADYTWTAVTGVAQSFFPQSGSIYKPGVVPLVSAVTSLNLTLLGTPTPYTGTASTSATNARAMIAADLSTRSVKDNTPGEANIVYLAGHDETGSVAGTKLMLETLLQLGISSLPSITVTTEVSRSNPIDATIGGVDAILQGTYGLTTPAPTLPTYSVNGDNATFTFPAVKGHLRARQTSTITSTASTFASGTILFDAAGGIPAPTFTGCGTWYTANCRTVFTTIAQGRLPTMHYVQQSEVATLGPLMASNLDSTNQGDLMQLILAGDNSLVKTLYLPALGGVDHSTVAVIGTSGLVNGTRPQMAYFGATDGMMHAVCASTGGACDLPGRELWAYLPRTSLSTVRYNTARIDGSPRVLDAYGDFHNTGEKSWRTILMFQTGWGDTSSLDRVPAAYALDISDPTNPSVLWEYSLANPAARGTYELGEGVTIGAGQVNVSGTFHWVGYMQTNNAGTGGSGNVVTAVDMATGSALWQQGYLFATTLRSGGTSIPPSTGIPGGAVGVDKTNSGFVTDVVFGTLYGDLWDVSPATGVSIYGAGKPLLRMSTDYHAIGAAPAIYTNTSSSVFYAVITTGGYVDTYPNDTTWTKSGNINYALGVSLSTPLTDPIINESKGSPDISFKLSFGAGEASYAQATVIGNQVFITTDTANVNDTTSSSAYGLQGATGKVYQYNLTNSSTSTLVIEGGASSVVNSGTSVYSGASDTTQQLNGTGMTVTTTSPSVDTVQASTMTRKLWLRTQ